MGGNRRFKQTSTNTGYSYYEGNEEGTKEYRVRTPGTSNSRRTNHGKYVDQLRKDRMTQGRRGRKRTSLTQNERYTF